MSYDSSGKDAPAGDPEDEAPQPTTPEPQPQHAVNPVESFGALDVEPPQRAVEPEPAAPEPWQPAQPVTRHWYESDEHELAAEHYTDVPASLELSYTPSDMGLSAGAYERAFPYEQRRRAATGVRARRVGRELIETVILAVLIFFAVRALVQNFKVDGASMEPSLHDKQYLLVNKALYFRLDMDRIHRFVPFVPGDGEDEERHLFRAPRRGDVIVFRFHLDNDRDFIKRVIGVPGDTVEVRDGTVYINGNPLQEDYILARPNYTYGPKTVPDDHYFVLGDNRHNSFDSHAWGQGCPGQQCEFVPEENIIGQAWVTYWPFDALGLINNKSLKPSAP